MRGQPRGCPCDSDRERSLVNLRRQREDMPEQLTEFDGSKFETFLIQNDFLVCR